MHLPGIPTNDYRPCTSNFYTSATQSANFGQRAFKFPPPDGFQPLNGANVRPETVITHPDKYVGTTIWSGNGGTQSINVGLKPDLVWIKKRSGLADHYLYDTVRGATNRIYSNTTDAESTSSTGLTAFTSNGFNLGNANDVNQSSNTYVSWVWKAGGNKNTFNVDDVGYASAAAAGLDGGTLTVTGSSVGTKQGFSIITYNGAGNNTNAATSPANSISHGLSQSPNFVITKKQITLEIGSLGILECLQTI